MSDKIDKEAFKKLPKFRATPPFKLKDKIKRNYQVINFKSQFGFTPETIILEKVKGQSNTFIVIAVLTEEEIKRVDALMEKERLVLKKDLDKLEKTKGGQDGKDSDKPAPKEKKPNCG